MNNYKNPRRLASESVFRILSNKEQMTTVINYSEEHTEPENRSLYRELTYTTVRYYGWILGALNILISKPLPDRDILAHYILSVGICQLAYTRIPPHAALNETVETMRKAGYPKYVNLTNAVMRNFIRRQKDITEKLNTSYESRYSFPEWLVSRIKSHYHEKTAVILENSNKHPPMWIRLNPTKCKIEDYKTLLALKGIDFKNSDIIPEAFEIINPLPADKIPLFKTGAVFIQDFASQYAVTLLPVKAGDCVLDCCAAPGGKSTLILEKFPDLKLLVALDNDKKRLSRIQDNLERLRLSCKIVFGDACANPESWSPVPEYDVILLDAPCSATGVIRRHPDIRWIRTEAEIHNIIAIQRKIIRNIWKVLKTGGTLLYTTCSIIPDENSGIIRDFLKEYPDAKLWPVSENESPDNPGLQRLPGDYGGDGFFYARIKKLPKKE
ncbi:16S rRNA (cytosine(967)-C(5))-methyltransferase RsmB [Succinimonas amylolytica]|uniref:16S rRNA (cytosine(967)-C(5))-methyltransferase RsmB n=1 Tax=Succinimonas amylolytica TaxID=83769 RepID=UPI00036F6BCC|nr:16S rRNA (cytosine(967)-C(5))-methyltransferase RsmB [Succinimonas amylolytica]